MGIFRRDDVGGQKEVADKPYVPKLQTKPTQKPPKPPTAPSGVSSSHCHCGCGEQGK